MYSKFDSNKKGGEPLSYSSNKSIDHYLEVDKGSDLKGPSIPIHEHTQKISRRSLFTPPPALTVLSDYSFQNCTEIKKEDIGSFPFLSTLIRVRNHSLLYHWEVINRGKRLKTYWQHLRAEFDDLCKKLIQAH